MRMDTDKIISDFINIKILAIGDLMIDQYLYGNVTRISPEAPVPVVDIENESYELGGAANAVNNIKSLGGIVEVVGVIGKDDAGKILMDLLREKDIKTEGIILSEDRPTTIKTRIIGNGNHIVRTDRETKKTIDVEISDNIFNYIKTRITEFDAILISDYDKGLLSQYLLNKLIALARLHKIPIVVNSKTENMRLYKNITVLVCDLFYASEVVGIKPINETSVRNVGQWLLTHLDCSGVVIIQGKNGISIFEREADVKKFSCDTRDIPDLTGVSDAVTGVMALALGAGSGIQSAAIIANAAAKVVFENKGTHVITKEELSEQIL